MAHESHDETAAWKCRRTPETPSCDDGVTAILTSAQDLPAVSLDACHTAFAALQALT